MDPRERLARLAQLKAEGDMIMQELIAAGMPPEQIMAAVEAAGQPAVPPAGMNIPGGMGGRPGPDLPAGIPANGGAGIQATNAAMGMGGPRGLLAA